MKPATVPAAIVALILAHLAATLMVIPGHAAPLRLTPLPAVTAPAISTTPGATPAPAPAPPAPAAPVQILSRDSRAVEFEYVPGPGRTATVTDAKGAAQYLDFDGAIHTDEPGLPVMPLHTERVIVPEGAAYQVEFSIEGESTLRGLRFPVVPVSLARPDAHGPWVASPGKAPADEDRLYPDAPVAWSLEEFRGQRILLFTLAPLQFNPAAGTTQLFSAIRVRITFSGARALPSNAAPSGPIHPSSAGGSRGLDPLLTGLVLNPEAAAPIQPPADRRFSATPGGAGRLNAKAAGAAGVPPVYFGNAPQWVKLRIKKNGFYRLTGSDLSGAGVAIASIDPATIRVFSGPGLPLADTTAENGVPQWGERGGFREVGRTVHDNSTAHQLDPDDDVIFYGLGPDNFMSWYDAALPETWVENENTDATVIWVTWGGQFPAPPVEIGQRDATPGPADAPVTTVQDKIHVEKNDPAEYDPLAYETGIRWELWWWQLIDSTHPTSFWDVDLPDVDTSRPGSVFVRWWGANLPAFDPADPEKTHFLNMTVDDSALSMQWTGGVKRHDVVVDSLTLRPRNRITALVPRIGTGGDRIDQIRLAWFEFTYWKKLNLARNTLWFKGGSAAPGPVEFRIGGAATDAAAYDVTDPGRPVRMAGTVAPEGTDRVLAFHEGDPAGHLYAAVNAAGYLKPASIAIDTRPSRWLRETDQPVDYLIITWDDFLPAAQMLADWRRSHLAGITENRPARVAIARVTDIYDEFSGGMVDPAAIRNFIQYVFHNWGPDDPDRLSYVCLMGDANRDTRDRKQTGVPNLMPTWEGGIDNLQGIPGAIDQYSSDDFFGRLQGPSDRFTDIIIGRIPVVSELQARETVRDKIIRAEQFPGFNPNRNRAILVADDVCQMGNIDDLTTTHIWQTENVGRSIPFPLDLKKIYLYEWGEYDCSMMVKPQAKRELIRSMNEGAFLVNYIGHGSDQQLADERVLEAGDVTTLDNRDGLPLLIAASCSVGRFDHPDLDGLAELLVKTPSGGALATIAATHLSVSGDNGELDPMIIGQLFPDNTGRSEPVGKALLAAKLQHIRSNSWCTAGNGCDRDKKYLVLGDPGSVVIAPRGRIRFTDMPDTLRRGSVVTVNGEVLNGEGQRDPAFQGTLDLVVQDQPVRKVAVSSASGANPVPYYMPGAVIFTGRSAVQDGRFTATFVVPMSLRGGDKGRIRAYAGDQTADAAGADSVVVGGFSSAVTDTTPPTITLAIPRGASPGQDLDITIEDAGGINLTQLFEFRSIQFVIDDDHDTERFRADVTSSFSYDSGSYTRGAVRTAIPELPAGHYLFHVFATDNFNNRGEGTLSADVTGAGSRAALSDLYGLPNPFRQSTQIAWALNESGSVKLSIYSVSGRKVREWSVDGSRGENRIEWDGADERGDAVANGVYLVRVVFRPTGGGKARDLVEPIVRVR